MTPTAAAGPDLLAEHGNLVVLRTFSKAYGLASLRVGYALAHPLVADALRATAVPFGVSGPAQAAALASLDAEDELLERVDRLVAERDRLRAALAAVGWDVPDPQGNFVWLAAGDRTDSGRRGVRGCPGHGPWLRGRGRPLLGRHARRPTTCWSGPWHRSRPRRDRQGHGHAAVRDRIGLKNSDLPADTVVGSPGRRSRATPGRS